MLGPQDPRKVLDFLDFRSFLESVVFTPRNYIVSIDLTFSCNTEKKLIELT